MKNRFLPHFLAVTTFLLFAAVCCDPDYDPDEKLVSIEVDNLNNAAEEIVLAQQSVKKEAFALGIKLFSSMKGWKEEEWLDPQFTRKDEFVNIMGNVKILANTDFNSHYPKGSDISRLFDKYYRKTESYEKAEPPFDVYSYLLILREAPDAGEHSFKIVYDLHDDDQESIEFDTAPITMN